MTDERAHWESTYAERTPEKVSWFEPCPQRSLELIQAARVGHEAGVLDVGGGASSLAAHMLSAGYTDLTVADISPAALAHARAELGGAPLRNSAGSTRTSAPMASTGATTSGTIAPCFTLWSARPTVMATSKFYAEPCGRVAI